MQQIAGKKALFLSTLSLRRATRLHPERYWQAGHFYPRSPCGERHHVHVYMGISMQISIHALLAESDLVRKIARSAFMIFLSTLSLRRATIVHFSTFRQSTAFLSTLSLRRATGCSCAVRCRIGISIHALLAESDTPRMFCRCRVRHFYPRSPCGERPWHMETIKLPAKISIHALLAESDNSSYGALDGASISIHALLAESDSRRPFVGEELCQISIHALLAESDAARPSTEGKQPYFYPLSPCGERRQRPRQRALP